MKTDILKMKGDWIEVRNDCRFTMGLPDEDREPTHEWKRKILIAEHSPVRDISFKWDWLSIKHWVTVHWVRHKWEKFVRTQRSDRTGTPRDKLPQDEPQDFRGEANVQNLIDTMRKRLCFCASKETREYAEDLKVSIHEVQPEIADVLVPNCVYRCGCPEDLQMKGCECTFFEYMCKRDDRFKSTKIAERYDAYNEVLYGKYSSENVEK